MKKFLAAIIVFSMLVTAMIPVGAVVSTPDYKKAFDTFQGAGENVRATILGALWDYAFAQIGNGNEVQVGPVCDQIVQVLNVNGLPGTIVSNESQEGNGKISRNTLEVVVQKLINNKEDVLELYSIYTGAFSTNMKAFIKGVLGLEAGATDGAVFAKMLNKAPKIIKKSSDGTKLESVAAPADVILVALGLPANVESLVALLYSQQEAEAIISIKNTINGKVNNYVLRANKNIADNKVSIDDMVEMLSAYNLYLDVPQTTPAPGTPTPIPNTPIPNTPGPIPNTPGPGGTPGGGGGSTPAPVVKTDKGVKLTVEATLNGTTATASLSAEVVSNALKDVKAGEAVTISITVPKGASEVKANIPASLFTGAAEKGAKETILDLGVAKLNLPIGALKLNGAKDVSISAAVVDKSKLSPELKAAAGDGVVYQFEIMADGKSVGTFTVYIQVSVPYTLPVGTDAEKVTTFYASDDGKLENIGGEYDSKTNNASFTTNHFSTYIVKANDVKFSDIGSFGWAKKSIEVMAAKGIINGTGDGNFSPASDVTRAQFAALVVRAFKLNDASAKSNFSDLSNDKQFYAEISSAVKAGIIKGYDDGTFAPNKSITRQEMAVMIARALEKVKGKAKTVSTDKQLEKFKDNSGIAQYAKDAVAMASEYAIVSGMTGDTFEPAGVASRAQAAAIIYRLYNVK